MTIWSLSEERIPLWDPYCYGGRSFIGEGQTGVFYPVSLAYFYFLSKKEINTVNIEYWINLLLVLHFVIASLGMFFLTQTLSFGITGSLISSLCFSLGGFIAWKVQGQANIFMGAVWLPLSVAFFLRSIRTEKIFSRVNNGIGAGITASFGILAGHFQPTFHAFLVLAIISGERILRITFKRENNKEATIKSLKIIVSLIIAGVAGVGISAVQWLPTLEYLQHVYRWVGAEFPTPPGVKVPYSVAGSLEVLNFKNLLNLLKPGITNVKDGCEPYFGLVALILAFIGIYNSRKIREFLLFSIIGIIYALGKYGPIFPIIYWLIPFGHLVREPIRAMLLFHLGMCVLAGNGADTVLKKARVSWIRKEFSIAIGILFIMLNFFDLILNLPGFQLMSTFKGEVNQPPSKLFDPMLKTVIPSFQSGEFRILIRDNALPENTCDVFRFQEVGGHSATLDKDYFDSLSQDWGMDSMVYKLLGVKYIISKSEISEKIVKKSTKIDKFYLHEMKEWYPMVRIISRHEVVSRDELLLRIKTKFEGFKNTVLLTSRDAYDSCPVDGNSDGIVQILYYEPEKINIHIKTTSWIWLVLAEKFDSGWKATLNGSEIHIYNANIIQRAICIPPGEHTVKLDYKPESFYIGIIIVSITTCLIILFFTAGILYNKLS